MIPVGFFSKVKGSDGYFSLEDGEKVVVCIFDDDEGLKVADDLLLILLFFDEFKVGVKVDSLLGLIL